MDNKLFELTAKRRSIRSYTGEPIEKAVLEEIMKVALTAPCSFGHRPVEFVVVQDQDRIRELASCKSYGGNQIIGAGAVIVVMVKLDGGEFWIEDGAIASSYILLAAEQYDVGACWVHIRNRDGKRKSSDEEIREILGVPDGYAVLNLVALGGKAETKRGYSEGDFDLNKIHYEKFYLKITENGEIMKEYINVSLVISSDDDYADVITNRLDITPTQIRDKDSFQIKEFEHCEWIYSTGDLKVRSLSDAVVPILTVFGKKRDTIISLTKEIKGKCDIVVVISAFSGDGPEVVLDKDLISFSNDIKAEIGFDLYFYDRE